MTSAQKYHAIVIGSGQAGTPLAAAFAKAGHKTTLIERTHIGGCCVNEGCTPTKTLIASGRAAYLVRRGHDYGIHTSEKGKNEVRVDMLKVRERKREIVESFRGGNEGRVASAGVEVMTGEASFVGEKTMKVKMSDGTERVVEGEKIFINTGERPAPPELGGIASVDPTIILDSTSIQELDIIPENLVVIGGGYVGVEFAQLFARLGAKVTILQRGIQLLPHEDPDIAASLHQILVEDGLTICLRTTAVKISAPDTRSFTLEIQTQTPAGTEFQSITGSHLLYAVGRIPNTKSLDLQAAGIAVNERGYIVANEFLETSAKDVYALGDVKGPPAFTHISYDDFRIIQNNLLTFPSAKLKASTKDRLIPYVVYTDPQLGHVGLHEKDARNKFPAKKIKTAKMPMSYVARALETDESRGMMKAVIDAETGQILGFTCLGMEGGEVMAVVQMAMMGGLNYEKLRDAIWAHPSLAESLNNIWGSLE
jgi:pyruvate/2-oxoglutarate dehydrogenase complex dihydrolipoamide dehydrogenase (E3) component